MLRELLSNYICATERAEQQSDWKKAGNKYESLFRISTGVSTLLPYSQTMHQQLILHCRYCDGNHWSDQCVVYPTCRERKQVIKDSCFLCLKQGHIANRCLLFKTCFYCGREKHHHRSLVLNNLRNTKLPDHTTANHH